MTDRQQDTILTSVIEGRRSSEVVRRLDEVFHFPDPILDATFGLGRFWLPLNRERVVGMDKYSPQPDVRADWGALPFRGGSVGTVVFDPPHAGDTGQSSAHLTQTYGNTTETAWTLDGYADYRPYLREFVRVLRSTGMLVVKAADMIHNHIPWWLSLHLYKQAQETGFQLFDWVTSYRTAIIDPRWTTQYHARKNSAHWMLFLPPGARLAR